MNDRSETAPDPQRLDRPSPPPGPWWSQPRDPWDAPGSPSGSVPAGGSAQGDPSGELHGSCSWRGAACSAQAP